MNICGNIKIVLENQVIKCWQYFKNKMQHAPSAVVKIRSSVRNEKSLCTGCSTRSENFSCSKCLSIQQ